MTAKLKHVLMIDDDGAASEMMYMWLGSHRFALTSVRTPQAGLRRAKWRRFDLYLLGGLMPDENGKTLCRQIREIDRHTPIILYSADTGERARQRALADGAQAYLIKPDKLSALAATIARLIEERQQA